MDKGQDVTAASDLPESLAANDLPSSPALALASPLIDTPPLVEFPPLAEAPSAATDSVEAPPAAPPLMEEASASTAALPVIAHSSNFEQKGDAQSAAAGAAAAPAFLKGVQAIVVEATGYSKSALDRRVAFLEKLRNANSIDSAIKLQSEYAKASFAALIAQTAKMGGLYSSLAKTAFMPFTRRFSHDQSQR